MNTTVGKAARWGCIVELDTQTAYPSIQARDLFRRFSGIGPELSLESVQPDIFPDAELSEEQIDRQFSYSFMFMTPLERDAIRSLLGNALRGMKNVVKIRLGQLKTPDTRKSGVSAAPAQQPVAEHRALEQGRSVRGTMRVDLFKIEELVNLIGELIINKNQVEALSGNIIASASRTGDIRQDIASFHTAKNQLGYVTGKLRDLALGIRMVPVSQVIRKFPTAVREMARKTGKRVNVIVDGEETELDKAILEEIADPLLHIIRNAVDHGIELPEERERKGKFPEGTILIRAEHEGDRIALYVEDDGGGLDEIRILRKAVENGIVGAKQAEQLSQREIFELIFAAGFSTAEQVSELSGRGVGMDVVKNNIARLNGIVEVESGRDVGTRITLKLPLTLSILEGLLFEDLGQTYAIPLIAIERAYLIESDKLKKFGRYSLIEKNGHTLPVFRIAELFGHENAVSEPRYYLIEASSSEGRFGLLVQRILGRQEIVLKPLGDYLGKITGISGSTILGNGKVALIVDTKTIADSVNNIIREYSAAGAVLEKAG
jgi:two-component system chemotaxis sensor kinase CheA